MTEAFYTDLLQHIQHLCGSDLSGFDQDFIRKRVDKRINETALSKHGDYLSYLKAYPSEAETLHQMLFISYSNFFRNPLTFALLEKSIFPHLIMDHQNARNTEIRIWSAGCAAGQEPYSLAILLENLRVQFVSAFHYRIFATDLSPKILDLARRGIYRQENLLNLPLKFLNKWFNTENQIDYQINPSLASSIDFSTFDLLNKEMSCPAESIFGNFDMVVCANLLIYYQPAYRDKIIAKLLHCLKPGGYLVCGEAEREIFARKGLIEVFGESAIFQRKT